MCILHVNVKHKGAFMDKILLALFGLSVLCGGCTNRERVVETRTEREVQDDNVDQRPSDERNNPRNY